MKGPKKKESTDSFKEQFIKVLVSGGPIPSLAPDSQILFDGGKQSITPFKQATRTVQSFGQGEVEPPTPVGSRNAAIQYKIFTPKKTHAVPEKPSIFSSNVKKPF